MPLFEQTLFFLLHSTVGLHLDCFLFGAVMFSAAMNIFAHVLCLEMCTFLVDIYLVMELQDNLGRAVSFKHIANKFSNL